MSSVAARPELLAPAGDWDCVRAAVENGADAVYFGLDCGFNARHRAKNFAVDELQELMQFLHLRNVRGYVTLNTLAFTDELSEVRELIGHMVDTGVDAVLVQDFGVARMIRSITPDLPIHASTQMTLTSAECIQVAEQLDICRVVLARELSIAEIREIRQHTNMPLEVFVHGALCVAYSGQCLTSESLGGRSANRGQCAQACRLAYELVCDGEVRDLGDQKYLLSPQDLAAYELTPELIAAGISSFKIEGRLKTPEYVANITRHYRHAMDRAIAGLPVQFNASDREEMELSFSRGFSPGWLQGCDHKMLVPAISSAKRGLLLGTVQAVRDQRVAVELRCPIARGDGVVFEGDRTQAAEQGGRVFHVIQRGFSQTTPVLSGHVELEFDDQAIDVNALWIGQQIWKTDDPRLNQRLRKSFTGVDPVRRVALNLHVTACVGLPLQVQGSSPNGATCKVVSEHVLEPARKHPVSVEVLRDQLGRLGGTVFELGDLTADVQGDPMVPLSVLGIVRKEMLEQLHRSIPATQWHYCPVAEANEVTKSSSVTDGAASLHVLCRTLAQLDDLLSLGEQHLYADFQDIREYREAVRQAKDASAELWLATPRIQKPGEMGVFRALAKYEPTGVLARNLSGLHWFHSQNMPVRADFSLNVANPLAARFVMDQGCERLTPAYDLNRDQLLDLVRHVPTSWLEVVVHQHVPMFHMEHCVFCAVLSPGTNKNNCGRPCDTHVVELRDRIGMEHPLTADVGCRNTLFNVQPQSAAEIVPDLQQLGVRHFRVELLREERAAAAAIVQLYRQLLQGNVTGHTVWQQLKATNCVGITRGTLEERRNPLALV